MGNDGQIGLQAGLAIGGAVARGLAEWKQIQLEKQQGRELEAVAAKFNQRVGGLASADAEDADLLQSIQAQIQRSPDAQIVTRPTGRVTQDGQAESEQVIRTREGDIPVGMVQTIAMRRMQAASMADMARIDEIMQAQYQYPGNPKIAQWVAATYAGVKQKLDLQAQQIQAQQIQLETYKLQQQNELGQQELQLKKDAAQLEREKFEAAPQRERDKTTFETDEKIRGDRARISAEQAKDLAVEQAKLQSAPAKAPTETQSKAANFGRRAEQALGELNSIDYDRSSLSAGASSMLPNMAKSAPLQRIDQAERNFLNAVLRRDSGAVISPTELDSAAKQYFVRAGDKPETIQQKARNRAEAVAALKGEAGAAWDLVPAGATAQSAAGGVPPDIQSILDKYK